MASPSSPEPTDGSSEHPYITSLVKSMRAINKKISGMAKTDAVIKENPNVSLDDLVAQRKLNQDQKAQALKKPQLQAQLVTLEEQVQQYRKFDAENQAQIQKLKEELTFTHSQELEKIKQETQAQAVAQAEAELKKKLLIFSQFLQAAAAKRIAEEDPETDENKAFEGTLLLVYGGDQKAVDTALNLIEGSDEHVTSIEGTLLPVKFSQVKQAAVAHAPSTEEVDAPATVVNDYVPTGSDPTTANAGLTELQQPQTNGVPDTSEETESSTVQTEGNVAGERWDTAAGAEKEGIDEGYEVVPRPNEEVDTPAAAPAVASQPQVSSWADDSATGNLAGEAWDTKAPGQEVSAEIPAQTNGDDGFHEVAGKARGGRGGARGRGEGETRGGRGGRGGRGRGGPRGGRGDGEAPRGRGGRGRGPRGDGNAPARA